MSLAEATHTPPLTVKRKKKKNKLVGQPDRGAMETTPIPLDIIVGAPPSKGGGEQQGVVPRASSARQKRKRVVLSRIFEYAPDVVADEREAARLVLELMEKRRKTGSLGRGTTCAEHEKGKQRLSEVAEEIDDGQDDNFFRVAGVEHEEEAYVISPLYPSALLETEPQEDEFAVFQQAEHQHTGLLVQTPSAVRRDSEESSSMEQAEEEETDVEGGMIAPESSNYDARLLCSESRRIHELEDLRLDTSSKAGMASNSRMIEAGPTHGIKRVCNAFHQVPGRPNVYAFQGFSGTGFDGCGIHDAWSNPDLISKRDEHVQSWQDGSYDYVMQGPEYTPAMRRDEMTRFMAKSFQGVHFANTTREEAKYKLDCLTRQLKEYCGKQALQERAIDSSRIVLWQGDPQPKIVFLFKAPTNKVLISSDYDLSHKCGGNHLGILQGALREALEEIITECYRQSYDEPISWQRLREFVYMMIPMCCQDTHNKHIDTNEGGIALLYGVPMYDPTGWGKHSIDAYGCTEYDTDYTSSVRDKNARGSNRQRNNTAWTSAAQEFPDNVLELTSFYVQKALDLMSPMVVISMNKFLTKYLNSNLDAKMLQWAREVRPNKWFRVNLISARAGSLKRKKDDDAPRLIQYVDPETGVVVYQRADCFGIRSYHPFYVESNRETLLPGVHQTMKMVVSRIFRELEMRDIISGKGHALSRFYVNPMKAMRTGEILTDGTKSTKNFPSKARWLSGNLICREASSEQVQRLRNEHHIIDFIHVCDCPSASKCKCMPEIGQVIRKTCREEEEGGELRVKWIHCSHIGCLKRIPSGKCEAEFPPKLPAVFFTRNAHLWPTQWIDSYVRVRKDNTMALPRLIVRTLDEYHRLFQSGLDSIRLLVKESQDRSTKLKETGGTEENCVINSRFAVRRELSKLEEDIPSLFTKRAIIDCTHKCGDDSVDVAVYVSSMIETTERVLYLCYMKDYLEGKRQGIAGSEKPKIQRTRKRAKSGGKLLTPAEQLPSVGRIIGHVIKTHAPYMERLERQRPPLVLEEDGEEEHEEEEEEWGVFEWTEALHEVVREAKRSYDLGKRELSDLSP